LYIGELAALATALLFAFTSVFFTLAGRQVGSMVVNRARLLVALGFLLLAHLLFRIPLPLHAGYERWFWLGISGIVGLALGDLFLFQAFIMIGPRLSMLLMALAPVLAALLAWLFLGETLSSTQVLGIFITLAGIAWVIAERRNNDQGDGHDRRYYLTGILFGLGAATGQALGLILAKKGLAGDFPALSATLIRMVAAAATLWIFTFLQRQATITLQRLNEHRQALGLIVFGAFFGPFLGVTFSLISIQHTAVGIASTLIALTPVFLLPISYFLFKERFGWQAIAGTLLAMVGGALLFLF